MATLEATLDCLKSLIAFETVSKTDNRKCIAWVDDYLGRHGAEVRLDCSSDGTKANLLARFGSGSGGLLLSGHVDVVPVDDQLKDWSSAPFEMSVADGRAYGRGACDMKGFLAVLLANAPRLQAAKLREPIYIALTYDEEIGCRGVQEFVKALDRWDVRPRGAVIGEPTSMRLVPSHKGGLGCCIRATGFAVHSSRTPEGVNAINAVAKVVLKVEELAEDFKREGPTDPNFDVPYSTLSTNTIKGGNAGNTIPAAAEAYFEFRYIPTVDRDAVLNKLQAYAAEVTTGMRASGHPECEVKLVPTGIPGGVLPLADRDNGWVRDLVSALIPAGSKELYIGGVTEASTYQRVGIPTVVCGPGSLEQAHKPNEWVSLSDLAACDTMVQGFIAKMTA